MEANRTSESPSESPVLDCATLYLCRQGRTWVVVVESPGFTGALLLRHAGPDSFDARYELLSRTRRARPGAAVSTTDGAVEGADYEWRLDVRCVEESPGDLGLALRAELSDRRPRHQRRLAGRQAARHCRDSWFSSFSGRPLSF
jgi:hypothetical protein